MGVGGMRSAGANSLPLARSGVYGVFGYRGGTPMDEPDLTAPGPSRSSPLARLRLRRTDAVADPDRAAARIGGDAPRGRFETTPARTACSGIVNVVVAWGRSSNRSTWWLMHSQIHAYRVSGISVVVSIAFVWYVPVTRSAIGS